MTFVFCLAHIPSSGKEILLTAVILLLATPYYEQYLGKIIVILLLATPYYEQYLGKITVNFTTGTFGCNNILVLLIIFQGSNCTKTYIFQDILKISNTLTVQGDPTLNVHNKLNSTPPPSCTNRSSTQAVQIRAIQHQALYSSLTSEFQIIVYDPA